MIATTAALPEVPVDIYMGDVTLLEEGMADFNTYDYDYIMAPQRGRPYGANLGSMGT